ncbi:hypothetical protein [uncultured Jannaschia sp.]|uniref:hypothetical protein n=1 Tax=uncultured Jannaschia sp. TaxID=293347 RepID=UPI00260ADDF3|nr:hypothetical protein [uncultured Jannaschia sp.]
MVWRAIVAGASLALLSGAAFAGCVTETLTVASGVVENSNGTGRTASRSDCLRIGNNEAVTPDSWSVRLVDGGGVKKECRGPRIERSNIQVGVQTFERVSGICYTAHAETGSGTDRIGMEAWAVCEIRVEVCSPD